MQLRRHWVLIALVLVFVWFGSIIYWATRDFEDAVPVGTDYNAVPPAAARVSVECNSPLSSTVRDSEVLPSLAPQPADRPPLAFTRQPCVVRRDSARTALAIDGVVFVGAVALLIAVGRRRTSLRQQATFVPATSQ